MTAYLAGGVLAVPLGLLPDRIGCRPVMLAGVVVYCHLPGDVTGENIGTIPISCFWCDYPVFIGAVGYAAIQESFEEAGVCVPVMLDAGERGVNRAAGCDHWLGRVRVHVLPREDVILFWPHWPLPPFRATARNAGDRHAAGRNVVI